MGEATKNRAVQEGTTVKLTVVRTSDGRTYSYIQKKKKVRGKPFYFFGKKKRITNKKAKRTSISIYAYQKRQYNKVQKFLKEKIKPPPPPPKKRFWRGVTGKTYYVMQKGTNTPNPLVTIYVFSHTKNEYVAAAWNYKQFLKYILKFENMQKMRNVKSGINKGRLADIDEVHIHDGNSYIGFAIQEIDEDTYMPFSNHDGVLFLNCVFYNNEGRIQKEYPHEIKELGDTIIFHENKSLLARGLII